MGTGWDSNPHARRLWNSGRPTKWSGVAQGLVTSADNRRRIRPAHTWPSSRCQEAVLLAAAPGNPTSCFSRDYRTALMSTPEAPTILTTSVRFSSSRAPLRVLDRSEANVGESILLFRSFCHLMYTG